MLQFAHDVDFASNVDTVRSVNLHELRDKRLLGDDLLCSVANAESAVANFFANVIFGMETAISDSGDVWLEFLKWIDPVIIVRGDNAIFLGRDGL